MQVFVRGDCTMIAAPVQCDVDGVPQGSRFARSSGNCDPAVIRRPGCSSLDAGIVFKIWSGARDLNPGPHGPEPCALPNCASPRLEQTILFAAFRTRPRWVETNRAPDARSQTLGFRRTR